MKLSQGLLTRRTAAVGAAAVAAALLIGATSATAASMVTGAQIADGTITSADVKNGSLWASEMQPAVVDWFTRTNPNTVTSASIADGSLQLQDLSKAAQQGLKGATGATGATGAKGETGATGAKGDKGDAGQPGLSQLIAGAGYTQKWAGDEGATLQTTREECPEGQYALGGGFSTWGGDKDLGGDNKDIQVTVSAPYFEGDYVPVDEAGNFRPTEWVVKGYNNGTTEQIVRAWVTCATIAK
jgi:hypothetical protein